MIARSGRADDRAVAPPSRLDRLDALRGAAIVWMAAYHFGFDLAHFGYTRQNFYADPLWTTQRVCILSLFLLCAGAGQAVARGQRQSAARFWRRWAEVAGCAVLVSLGSAWMFPRSYISFGVLHCIAVGLIVLRASAGWGRGLWLAGALALLLPHLARSTWFDGRWTNWIGLVTAKPVTEDYVPLLPWIGVMWWGFAAGAWLLARRPHWLGEARAAPAGPAAGVVVAAALARLGRVSLAFYMLHQPVLIGALTLFALVWPGAAAR